MQMVNLNFNKLVYTNHFVVSLQYTSDRQRLELIIGENVKFRVYVRCHFLKMLQHFLPHKRLVMEGMESGLPAVVTSGRGLKVHIMSITAYDEIAADGSSDTNDNDDENYDRIFLVRSRSSTTEATRCESSYTIRSTCRFRGRKASTFRLARRVR